MQMGVPKDKRMYEEVGEDFNKVVSVMGNYLEEYNMEHNAPLHLGGWGASLRGSQATHSC